MKLGSFEQREVAIGLGVRGWEDGIERMEVRRR
jgi:hypothetical protein